MNQPYKEAEDRVLWSVDNGEFELQVRKYKEYPSKLALGRFWFREGERQYKKVGRLGWDDVQFLQKHLDEAIAAMDKA